jgi:pimeloyl-ACP methyl ester carboxylesterase
MEIKRLRLPTVVGVGALLLFSHPSHAQKMTSTQPIPTGDRETAKPLPVRQSATSAQGDAIRPFKVQVPDAALMDLKRRVNATRWPDKETVADRSQGAQLANLQELLRYWGTSYDWRRVESRLNSYPNFITNIDGVDIQFIQVKSKEKNALPLIITHGWPGSVIEQLKIIDPLTNPTAHGGAATDAFDVVIPSIPGYGFSGKPSDGGWDPARVARAWAVLMKRLGYTRYVAQGGDWGSVISDELARQAPPGLLGIHINLAQAIPPDVEAGLATGMVPAGASEEERAIFNVLAAGRATGSSAYFAMMTARPQTLGYGQADSPAGLASWILVHPGFGAWKFGNDPAQTLTKDDVLDNITLYWLTNTAASSGRLYWENKGKNALSSAAWKTNEITLPVATTVFGEDAYRPPESWARRAFPKLIYYNKVSKGGHFAAWEQPELFASELRAAFRSLR